MTQAAALFIGFALTAVFVAAGSVALTAVCGELGVLELGCAVSVVCTYYALAQLRATRRFGWRRPRGEDDNDGWRHGGGGPSSPPPAPGSGPVDWEQFTAEFWAFVDERQRAGVR